MPTPPAPSASPAPRAVAAALLAVAFALAAVGAMPGVRPASGAAPAHAATVPSTLLPGAPAGTQVTLTPGAVRAPDDRAELEVALGSDAPGDVVVALALAAPVVDGAGAVTPGGTVDSATVTRGSRLQPGERLRAVVTSREPVLLVATVTGATSPDTTGPPDAPVELAALVLPGPVGPPPVLDVARGEDGLTGTVQADGPLLVTVRLAGADAATWSERLILPGSPLVVRGDAAPWPVPSVLTVTDEAGRTVTADTGRAALVGAAAALVVLAAIGLVLVARRLRRGRAASSAPGE